MAEVKISSVTKSFGATRILNNVSIDIHSGEFTVMVGPSGCGKSTLLRMLAGLEEIDAGSISIDNRQVNDVDAKDRDIAMVFQSYALYPHMTVAQNLAFSLSLRKFGPEPIRERVQNAANILGLSPLLQRYPRELSGGQRQRVAMGRAIVRDPKVFLFDEPLSNLDAKLRVAMRAEIKALHQRLKTTTIYVTHDQVEAMTMADRIVVMNRGQIEQIGSPLELYDLPCNLFVAQFIGSPAMNLIHGEVVIRNAQPWLVAKNGVEWPLPRRGLEVGQPLAYGIRPEDLRVDTVSGEGAIDANVLVVEPTGAQTEIVLDVTGDQLTVSATGRPSRKPGEDVKLHVAVDAVHLFDESTGQRISEKQAMA